MPAKSLGALRVEVHTCPQALFSLKPPRYLVKAVEMTDAYVVIDMELNSEDEVCKMLDFCRSSAKARHLTLKARNFTRQPSALFGITSEELEAY